jgi:hypothetical protein
LSSSSVIKVPKNILPVGLSTQILMLAKSLLLLGDQVVESIFRWFNFPQGLFIPNVSSGIIVTARLVGPQPREGLAASVCQELVSDSIVLSIGEELPSHTA